MDLIPVPRYARWETGRCYRCERRCVVTKADYVQEMGYLRRDVTLSTSHCPGCGDQSLTEWTGWEMTR